ncbi:MAG TPA: response regulator [Bryobacteraceae bacterium]|jgi:CheY-like chemotaxis protein|nr:response regulator [Bryobacteraceae bacterium]
MNAEAREIDIFIAEDNPADVRLIEEALRDMQPPPAVRVACDGEQVLQCLLEPVKPAPALLFLDLHLPKTDSREVLRRVREQQRLRDTAVVVLSSSEVEDLMREAYSLGADCYLSKPSDLDEFLRTIRRAAEYWLGLQRSAAAE